MELQTESCCLSSSLCSAALFSNKGIPTLVLQPRVCVGCSPSHSSEVLLFEPGCSPPCSVGFIGWDFEVSFVIKLIFCFSFPVSVWMRRLWFWSLCYIQVTARRTQGSALLYYLALAFWQPSYKTWTKPFYYHIVGKQSGKSTLVNPLLGKTTKKKVNFSETRGGTLGVHRLRS